MFDVFSDLKSVCQAARCSAWMWEVEFRPVGETSRDLWHRVQGIAPSLQDAHAAKLEAEVIGKAKLIAMGFQIKDTSY